MNVHYPAKEEEGWGGLWHGNDFVDGKDDGSCCRAAAALRKSLENDAPGCHAGLGHSLRGDRVGADGIGFMGFRGGGRGWGLVKPPTAVAEGRFHGGSVREFDDEEQDSRSNV